VIVDMVRCGSRAASPAQIIAGWLTDAELCLLAIDAPLGWPVALGKNLVGHWAGMALPVPADSLFHRQTDTDIELRLRKRPLEVGANLIARTAHAALSLLDELRNLTGEQIPLAWGTRNLPRVSAIEVYPAATLRAHGIAPGEYKKASQIEGRRGLLSRLGTRLALPKDVALLESSADAIDAVVCVAAGADFLLDRSLPPKDAEAARREGWIWAPPLAGA
jgi:Protein of unknown function (DUF429)